MGGPMSVYEENLYPWIADEKRCIRQAIDCGKIVIGVCLGAQMIASTLGARVYPHAHKEIGWFPVTLTEQARSTKIFCGTPDIFMAYHWHGDTFDIPDGAEHCAQSSGCSNQSFVYNNRVIALQFHIEATPTSVAGILAACGKDIKPATFVQDEQRMTEGCEYCEESNGVLTHMLDAIVKITK
jgi:GMP synthase (glutamine-hydrolysing)